VSYFQGHLEQVAIDAGHAQQGISLLDVAQLSQAISAKRQADALEAIADRLRDLNQSDMFHPEFGIAPQLGRIAQKVCK
jgi:hypothetical protein